MFVDVAQVLVKGGDGGRGSNAMRREKFVPQGGPWGGDGGRGGNVIFVVDPGLRTLLDFRYQRHYRAGRGWHGQGKGRHGRTGEDLRVKVPPGTVVRDADTGVVLTDLTEPGREEVVAKGGRGGRGNMKFATAVNKAPTIYEEGEPGEERNLLLELKVIADVGLVGFPNVGKSTLLAAVSAARPKIADYPFTTLSPNLGVVAVNDRSLVLADIPGLIAGAHTGKGIGLDFLRHIERTLVLIHVLDGAATEGRDPLDDFAVINAELTRFDPALAARPQIVAFNKMDLPAAADRFARVQATLSAAGYEVVPISAATGLGVRELMQRAWELLAAAAQTAEPAPELPERVYAAHAGEPFSVIRGPDAAWIVMGEDIERLAAMTPWQNEEAVRRFQNIFRKMGVEDTLRKLGAKDGDTVEIRGVRLEFSDG